MSNFFDTPNILDFNALNTFLGYVKAHTPSEMLADIRDSNVDPNNLPALGDYVKMLIKDPGLAHARILYAESVRQLEANPMLTAGDVSLLDAKWNVVACCLDLQNDYLEGFLAVRQGLPEFVRGYPDMSVSLMTGLWFDGNRTEAASVLEQLDEFVRASGRAQLADKLDEAGLVIEMFDKVSLWIRETR